MYLEVDTAIVPMGADVAVTFQPQQGVSSDCLTIEGRVVHQSRRGFGIAFDDLSEACSGVLAGLLPGLPPVAERSESLLRAL
jgi:hypothetical protein